ncbi:MAG: type II secretion system F family protein [Deltaproteobacteria bacterium]|nr:type II secretion system F family protein [Deltaproteobacteria bacterium]
MAVGTLFSFRAHDGEGRERQGVHRGASPLTVRDWLVAQGLFPLAIEPAPAWQVLTVGLNDYLARFQRVRAEDLIIFTRQLATLVNAGLPLLSCLKGLAVDCESRILAAALNDIAAHVEGGGELSQAFARHPKIFSPMFINMLRVGEASGKLDVILHRLADLQEYERETREQIKTATRYPKLAGLSVVIAIVILMTFVVPRFVALFARSGAVLPLPTRMLIGLNTVFHHYWYLLLAGVIAAVLFYRWLYRRESGRLLIDRLKLRLPIFGKLFMKINFGRFARIFSLLMESGIPVLTIFDIVVGVIDNTIMRQELGIIRNQVEKGKDIATPMRNSGFFPALMVQLVAVGERSGSLDGMMAKVADYFELESRYTIKNLTTLIEPLLLLVLGGFVLFLALAIFLPWWNMMNVFR